MSIDPSAASASAAIRCAGARDGRVAGRGRRPPVPCRSRRSVATASRPGPPRDQIASRQPSAASATADARPRPDDAPPTSAVRPASPRSIVSSSLADGQGAGTYRSIDGGRCRAGRGSRRGPLEPVVEQARRARGSRHGPARRDGAGPPCGWPARRPAGPRRPAAAGNGRTGVRRAPGHRRRGRPAPRGGPPGRRTRSSCRRRRGRAPRVPRRRRAPRTRRDPGRRPGGDSIFGGVGGSSSLTVRAPDAARQSSRTLTGTVTPVAAGSSWTIRGSPGSEPRPSGRSRAAGRGSGAASAARPSPPRRPIRRASAARATTTPTDSAGAADGDRDPTGRRVEHRPERRLPLVRR